MLSSSTYIISFFFFYIQSIVHLEFILVYGIKMVTIYIFLNGYPVCSNTIC